MSDSSFPTSWRDPEYVAAVVGTVATAALFYYSALSSSAPSTETVGFVLLWVLGPAGVAHQLARRYL
ncbi:hypothetical protein GRX03_13910 [Halovenus sp. WSH3]|uniref:Uncharacterized protein n=1 Tax=Halovenus carboxidivorans TaxID=2692199 RepID=A0A6B0T8X7_9EURY|nr:hypothetical protein [Halovenus carboxidivorans]MXR52696.1 hypothetical protein [Halovenus carboxidivorans]